MLYSISCVAIDCVNTIIEKRTLISNSQEIRALNIFQIKIHQVLTFMFRIKYGNSPAIFNSQFKTINHKYSTRYSKLNYQIPNVALKPTRFSIKFRGPHLWNSLIPSEMKTINSFKFLQICFEKTAFGKRNKRAIIFLIFTLLHCNTVLFFNYTSYFYQQNMNTCKFKRSFLYIDRIG